MVLFIAYVTPKAIGWDFENRNNEVFWLPYIKTVREYELRKLCRNPDNRAEYMRLERAAQTAGPGVITGSDFKFKDRRFMVKEGDDHHEVAYVEIVDFARKIIRIHWHDADSANSSRATTPATPRSVSPGIAPSDHGTPPRSPTPRPLSPVFMASRSPSPLLQQQNEVEHEPVDNRLIVRALGLFLNGHLANPGNTAPLAQAFYHNIGAREAEIGAGNIDINALEVAEEVEVVAEEVEANQEHEMDDVDEADVAMEDEANEVVSWGEDGDPFE